jgi:hypothetical protein
MTIKKGESWGERAAHAPDLVVGSDTEARRALEAARREGRGFPVLGLTGGDLCHTLGGRGECLFL